MGIIGTDNFAYLQHRGLGQLKAAGIAAILDHHALPGVATPSQSFAGRRVN